MIQVYDQPSVVFDVSGEEARRELVLLLTMFFPMAAVRRKVSVYQNEEEVVRDGLQVFPQQANRIRFFRIMEIIAGKYGYSVYKISEMNSVEAPEASNEAFHVEDSESEWWEHIPLMYLGIMRENSAEYREVSEEVNKIYASTTNMI